MKNISIVIGGMMCCILLVASSVQAQDVIRCATTENMQELREKYPEMGTIQDFENWLAPQVEKYKQKQLEKNNPYGDLYRLPVIFHIIHDGESVGSGRNIPQSKVESQITQMNNDFNAAETGNGSLCDPSNGANAQILFLPVLSDPNGNGLAERGINRINRNDMGWAAPGYDRAYIDETIKPESQWNPNEYINVWVLEFDVGLLGFAQFPDMSGLDGLDEDEGPANTDGVVVGYNTVGSCPDNGGVGSGQYTRGRTLVHELGHFLGLRHIWGDGSVIINNETISCGSSSAPLDCACGNDDFVTDTPNHGKANRDCPIGQVTCGTTDDVTNFMDYTEDKCLRGFSQGQVDRMRTVLENSPRRTELHAWNTVHCGSNYAFDPNNSRPDALVQSSNYIVSLSETIHGGEVVFYKADDYILLQSIQGKYPLFGTDGVCFCGRHRAV